MANTNTYFRRLNGKKQKQMEKKIQMVFEKFIEIQIRFIIFKKSNKKIKK